MKQTPLQKLLNEQAKRIRVANGEPARVDPFDGLPTTTVFRCVTCGEELRTLAACDRHPHPRIECVLKPKQLAR